MTWCSRPRLYWLTWDLSEITGVSLVHDSHPREVLLSANQDLESVCQEGWIKTDPDRAFPTFTTSRRRSTPGRKPAGIHQRTQEDLARWSKDCHRYPPCQYVSRNLLINKQNQLRLPSIAEKEYMVGFPVGYTLNCVGKKLRNTTQHLDVRHTLIGNSWSVPVVAWFLSQLFGRLGLCLQYTPQEIVDLLIPGKQVFLQSRLWRCPLWPLREAASGEEPPLGQKLSSLISVKGEDLVLTTPSSQLCKFQRLRSSIPARLWKWRVVSGWRWQGSKEHINSLELRAVLTSLKWRVQHKGHGGHRLLHVVDSLVVLPVGDPAAGSCVLRCQR